MPIASKNSPRKSRRGAITVLTAVLMTVMLIVVSFALDLGNMMDTRTDLQSAADAGALAGVGELIRGEQYAIASADSFTRMNMAANSSVKESDLRVDVRVGRWDVANRVFAPGLTPPNAVEVTGRRVRAPMFFAQIMGKKHFNMDAMAVAVYQPRDIMMVLDLSGSMRSGNKVGALKDAVTTFFGVLEMTRADDRVGFTRYASDATIPMRLSKDYGLAAGQIRKLEADGMTNMSEGMRLALDELEQNSTLGSHRLMVVMTDGKANYPGGRYQAKGRVKKQMKRAAEARIPIVAISFSHGADKKLMQDMARATHGVAFHVDGSIWTQEDDLKRVFREIATQRPLSLVH